MLVHLIKPPPVNITQLLLEIIAIPNCPQEGWDIYLDPDGNAIISYPVDISQELYNAIDNVIANHTPSQEAQEELQEIIDIINYLKSIYQGLPDGAQKKVIRLLILLKKYKIR